LIVQTFAYPFIFTNRCILTSPGTDPVIGGSTVVLFQTVGSILWEVSVANSIETMAKAVNPKTTAKATSSGSDEISLDRRQTTERREHEDATSNDPVNGGGRDEERRKAPRRRQIDPTTCERDYSDAEIEFMQAMDDYKRANGRMFPTCSEILEVLQKLGYEKAVAADEVADDDTNASTIDGSAAEPNIDSPDEEEIEETAEMELEQPPADDEI
jgi:hypothetical protein